MESNRNKNKRRMMRRALQLARRGWGRTSPNPMVGAVVEKDGRIVGEGFHRTAGTAHAEVEALQDAGEAARGATLYVNLEPCSTHGRTPPCTDAVIEAGVTRVVVGTKDPLPTHAGRGLEILKEHGIQTESDVCRQACENLNAAFFCWARYERPFVCLKMAMTLDGKIATYSGNSQWISGESARKHVQKMRQWADAVMVGAETVRQDDPGLTVREPKNWHPQPRRIVWSRNPDKVEHDLHIWQDKDNQPEFVHPDSATSWSEFLHGLGKEKITALLIEGGGELAASALNAGAVDQVKFFIAPKILGGRASRPVVGGPPPMSLDDCRELHQYKMTKVGNDYLITGYLSNVHRIN